MDTKEIFELIARCAREVVPGLDNHVFQRGDRLEDLGADSVDRAEIVTMVLEELSLKIARVEVFGPKNIGELADLLYDKMQ